MVMQGKKGYALKCESCEHEDAVFFDRRAGIGLKELAFKLGSVREELDEILLSVS